MKIRRATSGSGFRVLFKIRTAASGSSFRVLFKRGQGNIQRMVQYSRYYSKHDLQRLVRNQRIIQNTSCSVWFIIQGIIKKWSGYFSAYGSVSKVLFKIRPAASCSGFRVLFKIRIASSGSSFRGLFKIGQSIIQCMVQDSGYYSKYELHLLVHHSGVIQNRPEYYSVYGSGFRVLFKIRTASSGSSFWGLFKIDQSIIQCMVQDSGYYSKHDLQRLVQDTAYYSKYELQRLVQDSAYYSKMVRILFSVWFSIQGIIENTACSVWFRIQGIIQNTNCSVWFII